MYTAIVIDDHPAIRIAVRSILESSERFKVVGEAEDGPAGLDLIRQLRPDLAIADLELPKLSGLQLAERVRANYPEVRVLIFSAQEESIFASRAMQAGANGYVSKLHDMSTLLQAARSVLTGYSVFPTPQLHPACNTGEDLVKLLSDREVMVAQYLARGMSNKEIADTMLLSNKTVSGYKARIFTKLNIGTLVELVDFARANKLVV